jgi:hypothetical protein
MDGELTSRGVDHASRALFADISRELLESATPPAAASTRRLGASTRSLGGGGGGGGGEVANVTDLPLPAPAPAPAPTPTAAGARPASAQSRPGSATSARGAGGGGLPAVGSTRNFLPLGASSKRISVGSGSDVTGGGDAAPAAAAPPPSGLTAAPSRRGLAGPAPSFLRRGPGGLGTSLRGLAIPEGTAAAPAPPPTLRTAPTAADLLAEEEAALRTYLTRGSPQLAGGRASAAAGRGATAGKPVPPPAGGGVEESKGERPAPVAPASTRNAALAKQGSTRGFRFSAAGASAASGAEPAGEAAAAAAAAMLATLPPPPDSEAVLALRAELEEETLPDYVNAFDASAAAEEIVVGLLSVDDIAKREAALEQQRLAEQEAEGEWGEGGGVAAVRPALVTSARGLVLLR